jgi:hypothetical protein
MRLQWKGRRRIREEIKVLVWTFPKLSILILNVENG